MSSRRKFITLLAGAAAWPLVVRAQHAAKLLTVGFLGATTPSAQSQWTAAFVQRLRELGWIEGRSIAVEYRWTGVEPSAPLRLPPSSSSARLMLLSRRALPW